VNRMEENIVLRVMNTEQAAHAYEILFKCRTIFRFVSYTHRAGTRCASGPGMKQSCLGPRVTLLDFSFLCNSISLVIWSEDINTKLESAY
jgi:hypothetical protein